MKNISILIFFCLCHSIFCIDPWTSPYPDMREFRLPPPEGHSHRRLKDWIENRERVEKLDDFNPLLGSKNDILQESLALRDGPEGKRLLVFFNDWRPGTPSSLHYGKTFIGAMQAASKLYFLCGDPQLGRYVHDYTMHALSLPDWFYLGESVLSPSEEARSRASLITADIARTLVTVAILARDAFSKEEIARLNLVLRKKCMESSILFCRANIKSNSNWVPRVASGLLLTAKHLRDGKSISLALEIFSRYVDTSIEPDGSYGEGFSYFLYAASSMRLVFELLSDAEREAVFGRSSLRNSSAWLAYHYYFKRIYPEQKDFYKSVFCDANFFASPDTTTMKMLKDLYGDTIIDYLAARGGIIETPESLKKLPLLRAFDNGECFLRSSWTPDATVLSAQIHFPSRNMGHRRLESGNFTVGIDGFPIIMQAGNTNLYRRPIHQYATKTSSANTITLDGEDQVPVSEQRNSVLLLAEGRNADVLGLDLTSSFRSGFKSVRRFILRLKPENTVVVLDDLRGAETPRKIIDYLHFNNIRHDSKLEPVGSGYRYSNPQTTAWLWTGGSVDVENSIGKGYVVSDIISNWDEFGQMREMESGNAFKFTYGSQNKVCGAMLYAVIQPGRDANAEPRLYDGTLSLGPVLIRLGKTSLEVARGADVELLVFTSSK
jgi:hypothetical protein